MPRFDRHLFKSPLGCGVEDRLQETGAEQGNQPEAFAIKDPGEEPRWPSCSHAPKLELSALPDVSSDRLGCAWETERHRAGPLPEAPCAAASDPRHPQEAWRYGCRKSNSYLLNRQEASSGGN